jgi:hypothetical protein
MTSASSQIPGATAPLSLKIDPMKFLDKLFGRPTLDRFAAELIQAMREAGETDELRYDAPEKRIL